MRRSAPFTALALIALSLAGGLIAAHGLPPGTQVAIHFNNHMHADGFATPWQAALLPVYVQCALWCIMAGISAIALRYSRNFREPRTIRLFDTSWLALTALQILLEATVFARSYGVPVMIDALQNVLVGCLLLLLGNGLGTLSPNSLIGIRTPWTRASPKTWTRTHRICGPIFMLGGAFLILAGFGAFGAIQIPVLLLTTLSLAAIGCGISWFIGRQNA